MKTVSVVMTKSAAAALMAASIAGPSVRSAELNVPAQYATVQDAVNGAASGDTIRIAPGIYREQVLIVRKNLTLIGAPGAILRASPDLTTTLQETGLPAGGVDRTPPLLAGVASDVVLKGLVFEGEHLGDSYGLPSYSAITFSGTSGRVEDCNDRCCGPVAIEPAINPIKPGT